MKSILKLIAKSLETFQQTRGGLVSAAIAFYALLSAAPFLVAVVGIAGVLLDQQIVQRELATNLHEYVGQEITTQVVDWLNDAERPSIGGFTAAFAVAVLLFAASRLFSAMHDALNQVWGVPNKNGIPWYRMTLQMIRQRLIAIGLVLLSGLVMVLVIVWRGFAATLQAWLPDRVAELPFSATVLYSLGAYVLLVAQISMMFRWLPELKLAWRYVLVGSAVTAGLLLLGSWGVGMYLRDVALLSAYGGAGTVAIVFLWAYYSSQVFVLGAAFTRHYRDMRIQKNSQEG